MTTRDNTDVELTISEVAYPGRGLGRSEGLVVFVPGVLPGEIVRARIIRKHKRHADAALLEVLSPSPERTDPSCPLASKCPGCRYQHAAYSQELAMKQQQLESLMKRIGRIESAGYAKPVESTHQLEYRNKIKMHAHRGKKRLSLGYIGEDNRSVLDVPKCPLAVAEINAHLSRLRHDSRFADSLRSGMTVTLRHTPSDGAVYWVDRCERVELLTEQTFMGPLQVPCYSFYQVNHSCAEQVVQHVVDLVNSHKPEYVVDLYSGVGVFALAAASTGKVRSLGIDSDSAAIGAARRNADSLSLSSATFRCMSAEAGITKALQAGNPQTTMLILDPPRTGLPAEIVTALIEKQPGNLVYVSCAPDTLARDLRRFSEGGYNIESTSMFDMFPRTPYFETVVHLASEK